MIGADFRRTAVCRRDLLRLGAVSLAGFGALEANAARGAALTSRIRSVLLLEHYGGPSHIDTWDPKPGAPVEIRGEFGVIQTSVPGYAVTEPLAAIAPICNRLTIIRSMTHGVLNHNPATYYALTGRTGVRDAVQVGATPEDWPALGSVLASLRPGNASDVPFISLPELAHDQVYPTPGQWAGILGKRYDPLIVESDPNHEPFGVPALSLPAEISTARLDDRRRLLALMDLQIRAVDHSGMTEHYGRAWSMLTSSAVKKAFDLGQESSGTRDRYGRNKVGQSLLLSRRLIEAGVQFIICFSGSSPGSGPEHWDTHNRNFVRLREQLLPVDLQAFSALLEDLEARGLLESTLVVWSGEFGRTPQIGRVTSAGNSAPDGRDHWPYCYSIVLAGGGSHRGLVHGASDNIGAHPRENPMTPADLAATLYSAMGIDPHSSIRDRFGQPFALTEGNPVEALFS